MKANLGLLDKVVRITISVLVIVLFFTGNISENTVIIGIVVVSILLITSYINYCPIYGLCGINTKKKLNDKAYNKKNQNYFNK